MDRPIFVLIRYSIYTRRRNAWVIGRGVDAEEYKRALFDPRRLGFHERLFRRVTLPSLLSCGANMKAMIFASDELPQRFQASLRDLLGTHAGRTRLILVNAKQDVSAAMKAAVGEELSKLGRSGCYATVRLDDDDALSSDYSDRLSPYMELPFCGMAVSFARGVNGVYVDGEYTAFHEAHMSMAATGLAHINYYDDTTASNRDDAFVFSLGSHTKVDRKRPVILDSRESMYLRTIHSASDTNSQEQLDKMTAKAVVAPGDVRARFALDVAFQV